MKKIFRCFLLFMPFSIFMSTASGQSDFGTARHQYVAMPRDLAVVTTVVQPEAPLEFVETQLLVNVGTGQWIPTFKIRNRGTKPIRAFTVAFGGTDERGWKANSSEEWLRPGQNKDLENDNRDEIIALTPKLRDQLKLSGPMKGVMVLLVVSAEYADGSRFLESGYEPLQSYLLTVQGVLFDPRCKPKDWASPPPANGRLVPKTHD